MPRFITFCKLYWPRSNFNTEEIQWICSMYVSVETTKLHYIFFHVLISKQKRAFILSLAIFLITITRVRASTSPWKLYFKISLITLFPTHWKFFSKKLQFIISLLMENVTFKIVSMIVHTNNNINHINNNNNNKNYLGNHLIKLILVSPRWGDTAGKLWLLWISQKTKTFWQEVPIFLLQ